MASAGSLGAVVDGGGEEEGKGLVTGHRTLPLHKPTTPPDEQPKVDTQIAETHDSPKVDAQTQEFNNGKQEEDVKEEMEKEKEQEQEKHEKQNTGKHNSAQLVTGVASASLIAASSWLWLHNNSNTV